MVRQLNPGCLSSSNAFHRFQVWWLCVCMRSLAEGRRSRFSYGYLGSSTLGPLCFFSGLDCRKDNVCGAFFSHEHRCVKVGVAHPAEHSRSFEFSVDIVLTLNLTYTDTMTVLPFFNTCYETVSLFSPPYSHSSSASAAFLVFLILIQLMKLVHER